MKIGDLDLGRLGFKVSITRFYVPSELSENLIESIPYTFMRVKLKQPF